MDTAAQKSELGDGLVTLNAYYPARDDIQDEITDGIHKHPVSADQQAEGYGASDLLWSNKTVSAGAIPETASKCRSDMCCTGSW